VVSVHGSRGPVPSWSRLAAGDELIIRGRISAIGELLKSSDFKVEREVELDRETLQSVDLVAAEALLAPNSRYEGHTLDRVDLRRLYGFTVMGSPATAGSSAAGLPRPGCSSAIRCCCWATSATSSGCGATRT